MLNKLRLQDVPKAGVVWVTHQRPTKAKGAVFRKVGRDAFLYVGPKQARPPDSARRASYGSWDATVASFMGLMTRSKEARPAASTCRATQDPVASRWASPRRGNPPSSADKPAVRTAGSPKCRYGCGLDVRLNHERPEVVPPDERHDPH